MNILVTSPYGLYQDFSFSFVHNQAKTYVQRGHRVRVILPLALGKKDIAGNRFGRIIDIRNVDGVEICYVRYLSLGKYGAKNFNRKSAEVTIRNLLPKLLSGFKPDVIHGHTLDYGSEIGGCIKAFTGCPLVVTTHGGDTNVPFEKGQRELLKKYCDEIDTVAAVSKKLQDRLFACGTKTAVEVIHNGFLQHSYPEDYQKNVYRMIQVGNLIPSKRVDMTIRAFAKLREERPEMELTVIGDGPLRTELETLCEQLQVSETVRFLGKKPNREVFHRMCESGFFVMASKPEGFGIVYLEAMAAGCVAIGTQGEGIADIITHGGNGFLVPADDPDAIADVIRSCLDNRQKMDAIAEAGKQTALELTWEQNACRYEALFGKLIRGD